MNKKLLNSIIEKQNMFVPLIFTSKQMEIIRKYSKNINLTNNEKHMLYTSIRKKIDALETLFSEKDTFYIHGKDKILFERIEKAKEIIKRFSPKQVFVAGSFLFKEDYNDIDVFIMVEKGYKEVHEENLHIIKLTEKRLEHPIFQSASLISVSNFPIKNKLQLPPLKMNDIMSAYHESAIEMMENQKREITRHLVFNYYQYAENRLLDGAELKKITDSIDLSELEKMVKDILKKLFSNSYIYVVLHDYLKTLDAAMGSEKNSSNLKRYKTLYEEIIHETRRSKAEAA